MAETEFKYDVFISYNHADEDWVVDTLVPALEKAGLKACIDYKDLGAGEIASTEIESAIKASRDMILVLTQNWFKGQWTHFEAQVAITLDPSGKTRKIISLALEAGIEKEIPQALARYNWINFTNTNPEANPWKELFSALNKPDASVPATWKLPSRERWFYGHRYGDLATFTGRAAELDMLNAWLDNDKDNLLMLRALGGFGKSALAWTWFNSVDREQWPKAVWWSFYEKESGFESFLSETLKHLGVEVKESARQQVNDLLEVLRRTNILIVLDGFERLLRQYGRMDAALQSDDEDTDIDPSQRDCSSPLTETFLRGLSGAGMKSKVLMTTRLTPRILESKNNKLLKGCREEQLQGLSPDDAREYFKNEGISATRAEIIEVCTLYGYHPLSLSLLVGWINREEGNEHRGDIMEAKNLDIFDSIKANRHHVLERAYESLAPERRDLLSKISCFRGSMEYAVLKKVLPSPDLDKALLDLRKRGLLQYAGESQRYDLHPIVRHYAYDHFTDEKRRKEVHVKLAKHFIDAMPVKKPKVKTLEDLAPVIELYHHMVGAGNLDEAMKLFHDRLDSLYNLFGGYQLRIELLRALFMDGEDKPPCLTGERQQGACQFQLANMYFLTGQPLRALTLHKMARAILEKINAKRELAILISHEAMVMLSVGMLKEAESNLRSSIDLDADNRDTMHEGQNYCELGKVLAYCGIWNKSNERFNSAEIINRHYEIANRQYNDFFGQGFVLSVDRALRFLLMTRSNPQSSIENLKSAIECAQRALELADEQAKNYPVPRDYVRAYWLLGAAYCANNVLTLAEENLSKALNLCRQINLVDAEADILLDIARLSFAYALREAQGSAQDKLFEEAKSRAEEALVITERSGYVLQGADVNLFLAEMAMEQEQDKAKAKEYAETALKLATCDGGEYKYKVAYEEAEAMLKKLG